MGMQDAGETAGIVPGERLTNGNAQNASSNIGVQTLARTLISIAANLGQVGACLPADVKPMAALCLKPVSTCSAIEAVLYSHIVHKSVLAIYGV